MLDYTTGAGLEIFKGKLKTKIARLGNEYIRLAELGRAKSKDIELILELQRVLKYIESPFISLDERAEIISLYLDRACLSGVPASPYINYTYNIGSGSGGSGGGGGVSSHSALTDVLIAGVSATPPTPSGTNAWHLSDDLALAVIALTYAAPAFTTFFIGGTVNLELGASFGGVKTFSFVASNSSNINASTVTITHNGTPAGNYLIGTISSPQSAAVDIMMYDDPTTVTFTISANNTQGTLISRNTSVSWKHTVYLGLLAGDTPITESILKTGLTAIPGFSVKTLRDSHFTASGTPLAVFAVTIPDGYRLVYGYPKIFGNKRFSTSLGTESLSLENDGGIMVRTDSQLANDPDHVGVEYSITRNELAGGGNSGTAPIYYLLAD